MAGMIETVHLRKTFGARVAVDDLSLQVEAGQIYGLVGSDGAGKTTTIRLLVGAFKPDSGEARVDGYSLSRQTEQARASLGYLSQRFSLYEDLTVLENIRFFAELRGLSSQDWLPRCKEILEFVGLSGFSDRKAGQLSGGMKQKLGLASAIVTRPRVLLLDEPTTGVDPVTRQDFWQLLIRIVSEALPGGSATAPEETVNRRSVLITTPYMDEASRCHRVGFMRQGKIIAEGAPSELRARLNDRIIEVRGEAPVKVRKQLEGMPGVETVRVFGDRLHLRVAEGNGQPVMKALTAKRMQVEARFVPPTLEDVFIDLSDRQD